MVSYARARILINSASDIMHRRLLLALSKQIPLWTAFLFPLLLLAVVTALSPDLVGLTAVWMWLPPGFFATFSGLLGLVVALAGRPLTKMEKSLAVLFFMALTSSELSLLKREQRTADDHYTEFKGYFARVSNSQASLAGQQGRQLDFLSKMPSTTRKEGLSQIDSTLLKAASLSADMWGFLLRRDIATPLDSNLLNKYNQDTVRLYSEQFDKRIVQLQGDAARSGVPIPSFSMAPKSVIEARTIAEAVGSVPNIAVPNTIAGASVPNANEKCSVSMHLNGANFKLGLEEQSTLVFGLLCSGNGVATVKVTLTGPFGFMYDQNPAIFQ